MMSFRFTCLDVAIHANETFNAYVEKSKNGGDKKGYEMKMFLECVTRFKEREHVYFFYNNIICPYVAFLYK